LSENEPERKRRPHNDNQAPQEHAAERPPLVDDLVMGVRFFSRLPTGDRPHEPPDLTRIAMALPFASLVIGMLPALLLLGASLAGLPTLFAAGLAVTASVIVTGAMAEDALADSADGLFGGGTPERRLEIMKDSRHGTYGVAALCMFLLLRLAALSSLAAVDPLAAAAIWLAATLMARSGALWLTVALPPARSSGASAAVGRVTKPAFLMGAVFALILGLVLAAPGAGLLGFVFAVAVVALVGWGWTALVRQLVGGQTGDLIGALQGLLELSALAAFLLFV
jgi:adenosylcobinamide-GDP ribazoletransferase